mgnify:CR=1 FL=1
MRRFLSAIAAAALLALAATSAFAQTQNVQPIRRATYSAGFVALTPASSATDFFTLTGSATKTIWVHGAGCSGAPIATSAGILAKSSSSTARFGRR